MTDTQKDGEERNLNPKPEAVLAVMIYGDMYSKQTGGIMDFWDSLPGNTKLFVWKRLQEIEAAQSRHTHATPQPDPVRDELLQEVRHLVVQSWHNSERGTDHESKAKDLLDRVDAALSRVQGESK